MANDVTGELTATLAGRLVHVMHQDPVTGEIYGAGGLPHAGLNSLVSEYGNLPDHVQAGAVSTDTLVSWTPALSGARLWYRAEDALNQSGSPAAAGEAVYSIPNRIASVSRTDGLAMPLVPCAPGLAAGSAANAPIRRNGNLLNGIMPVSFGAVVSGGSTMRLATQAGAISPPAVHRIFVVAALRGTSFPYLMNVSGVVGNGLVSGNGSRQLRAGTDNQIFGTFTDSVPFLLSYERGGTEQLFEADTAVSSVLARVNGAKTATNTAAASGLSSDAAFLLGNRPDTDVATDLDFWEVVVIEGHMTQAEIWRMEGYLAHKYAIQTSLPGDHPYRSGPPQVTSGATAAAWDVHPYQWGYRQVMSGYHFELADDNIAANDGGQGTDQSRAVLYDLKPAARRQLAMLVQGAHSLRLALGIYYRGSRSTNGTSGLSDGIGPRLPQQRQHLYEFLRDAGMAGIAPEYWSPAPHWKTSSDFGNGTLWAGAAYSRATTLDSIRVSDATQYAAQITALTNAIVADLEDLHSHDTYPMRVLAFGLQNEPIGGAAAYGSCFYTPTLYLDVLKSLIPKIRNSTKLSSWGGAPNTVAIHANSWDGPGGSLAAAIVADATVLSTGKTISQELAYWTHHRIGEQNANADVTLTGNGTSSDASGQPYYDYRLSSKNPQGIPVVNNEYEFFSSLGRPQQFANLVQTWLNHANWMRAPLITLIHAAKPSTDTVTERYALASWRVPGDNGTPATDYAASLDYGDLAVHDVNYNAARPFIRMLRGAQWLLTQERSYNPNQKVGAFFRSDGKLVVVMLNAAAADASMSVSIGPAVRTMRGILYSPTVRDQYISDSSIRSNRITTTVAARTMQVWIEA